MTKLALLKIKIAKKLPRPFQLFFGVKLRRDNSDLNKYEKKIYSQNGEDGIIEEIFNRIGTQKKFFVEFGVEDAKECNTRNLKENHDWKGVWIDGNGDGQRIKKAFITSENINELFVEFNVPREFDLLSIDVDGNDLWIWKAIDKAYRPRVVVIEYNGTIPFWSSVSVKYNPGHIWDKTNYFGASLKALNKIAIQKGYKLVCCNKMGVNAFFIREDILGEAKTIAQSTILKSYYPVAFGRRYFKIWRGHKPSNKKMVKV